MSTKIAVFGMGYVGLTLSVILAEADLEVWGIEINEGVLETLKVGKPHFFEENLSQLLIRQLESKKLHLVNQPPDQNYDLLVISVGTPLQKDKKEPNLAYIDQVTKEVGRLIKPGTLVCMRSTVPVGFTRSHILPILERESNLVAGKDFHLVFAPERTAEGRALTELKTNSQIVGGLTQECTEKVASIFHKLTPTVVSVSSLEAAEFIKLMDNSYRDVHFAFANEMALFAQKLNLDVYEIISAGNIHYPRNNIPLPSPGVGGACLSKDPYIFIDILQKNGYDAGLLKKAREVNEFVPKDIVQRIDEKLKSLNKNLKELSIFFVGFAFKGQPETTDLRDSTSLWLLSHLRNAFPDASIKGYDPIVSKEDVEKLGVPFVSIEEGAKGADVLIIANNHLSYKQWDIIKVLDLMNKPAIVYDTWRMLDRYLIKSYDDVYYFGVGL